MPDSPEELEIQLPESFADYGAGEHSEKEAAAGASSEGEATPSVAADPEASASDLSFLSDELKERLTPYLSTLPVEDRAAVAKDLERGYLREADYTRKRQVESQRVKEAEALAEAGRKWNDLLKDEGLQRHVLAYVRGEVKPPQAVEEEPPDFVGDDPKAVIAKLDRRYRDQLASQAEQIRKQAREEALAEMNKPKEHTLQLAKAAEERLIALGVKDADLAQRAIAQLSQDFGGPENLQVETLERLLPRYVELQEAKAAQAAKVSTSRKIAQAEAASPRGGMGSAPNGSVPTDKLIRDIEKKLGRELSIDELGDRLYQRMLDDTGMSETEMDAALRRSGSR